MRRRRTRDEREEKLIKRAMSTPPRGIFGVCAWPGIYLCMIHLADKRRAYNKMHKTNPSRNQCARSAEILISTTWRAKQNAAFIECALTPVINCACVGYCNFPDHRLPNCIMLCALPAAVGNF